MRNKGLGFLAVLFAWAVAGAWAGESFDLSVELTPKIGDEFMPSERSKRIWKMDGRSKGKEGGRSYSQKKAKKHIPSAIPNKETTAGGGGGGDGGKDLDARRERYARDLKAFYVELLAPRLVDARTGLSRAESLGKIHDLFFDFLNLSELKSEKEWKPKQKKSTSKSKSKIIPIAPAKGPVVTYSVLPKYIPERDKNGQFKERWLYFKTLSSKPEVQDGPDGPVSKRFKEEFWQGVTICFRGAGLYKCMLMPRGHLKSTLGTQAYLTWRGVRDPSERHLIRSVIDDRAQAMMGFIKLQYESNERFRELYGNLGPPEKRDLPWNTEMLSLRCQERRGVDPTYQSLGMESDLTGGHFDAATMDDVVGETNTETATQRRKACQRVENMLPVLDPGTGLNNIGTLWESDDPHMLFIDPEASEMALDTSFMIVTCLDGDTRAPAPKRLSQLGYGKPIWKEKFNLQELERIRRGMRDDRKWFGQYFNQFTGTSLRAFHRGWIQRCDNAPRQLAKELKLNIFTAFDPTSGKEGQGKLDYCAGLVLGQTRDREQFYVLDGFKEKLSAKATAKAMVDLALKWREIALSYRAHQCRVAFEESAFTNYLGALLDNELRDRGVESVFSFETLTHNKIEKHDRIRVLAQPYEDARVFWPASIIRQPVQGGEPYDLIDELQAEFLGFPSLGNDDLLDAHAMAYELAPLRDFKAGETREAEKPRQAGEYRRSDDVEESDEGGLALGSYGE